MRSLPRTCWFLYEKWQVAPWNLTKRMFEKSNLLLALATRSRAPAAHGGNPQDRTGLATQTKPTEVG